MKGYVDVLLEHEGRFWFLDWKSDVLPEWTAEALEEHVALHYPLQADLYTLALVRLLGIRDEASFERLFGGWAYVFLRGPVRDDPRAAVLSRRPSFAGVAAIEGGLAAPGSLGEEGP